MAEATMSAKLIAEFTGTFLLIFTIGCNILSKSGVWTGVSIACVLMVAVFSFGGISGANFNPAVSLALAINGNLEWKDAGLYMAVQLAGGILAGFGYFGLFGEAFNLGPGKNFGWLSAGACEALYTFLLCFVVLNVAAVKKGCQAWFGLAIGFVIIAGAYGAGVVSGGCFNPAVAFGIDVSSAHLGFGACLVYTICEFAGAACAALLFKIVRPNGGEAGEEYSQLAKLVSEFVGTYILVLTVGLNVLGHSHAGAFSIAASLMCMIFALGDVSGANFNPAVTVALIIHKVLDPAIGGMYIAVQVLGGIIAAMTYAGIYSGKTFPLAPGADYHLAQAFVAELIFTFVLVLVVLCTAVKEKTKTDHFFGLAIGSCVTVGGCAIGAVSGGSLNPAVSFGLGTVSFSFANAAIYTVAEILGGALAAGLVMVTHAEVEDEKNAA